MSPRRAGERPASKSPDAFRTISEVAAEIDLPQHVLRFWETRFSQIRPVKRGGGRRYYRPDDIDLLKGIRHLLYGQGYTIKGLQRILKEEGSRFVQSIGRGEQQLAAPHQGGADATGELEGESSPPQPSEHAGLAQPAVRQEQCAGVATRKIAEASKHPPSLTRMDVQQLRDAVAELSECARVLSALDAVTEPIAGK